MEDANKRLLAPYVTSLDSSVYALKNLPEEVVAVLFAYYSRSRESLRDNLLRLLQDQDLLVAGEAPPVDDEADLAKARQKAREFHEKWVVGYGHASVAEHAVAHLAIEDVSILASKVIEDCRLAAYTEKSTRYIPFPRAYYSAPELTGAAAELYRYTVESLFDTYMALLEKVPAHVETVADRSKFKTDRGFKNSCLAQSCDALRYLLPAATHTNIGVTANARTLEHMISKLLSHPLAELQETGERLKTEAQKVIPTLIKYARTNAYWQETAPVIRELAQELLSSAPTSPPAQSGEVRLLQGPDQPEARLAAAILYEHSDLPYEAVWRQVQALAPEQHQRVIREYDSRRRMHGDTVHGYKDPPLRALEHLTFTFEILVDYGAYRDIQRHRLATQTTQPLTCAHGYDVPELLTQSGFEAEFRAAMDQAASTFAQLTQEHPQEAQYVVPLAYRKRVLFTWNLRELHHFISLRSARQGHISYRRVAQAAYRELEREYPFLAQFIRVDLGNYEMARPG